MTNKDKIKALKELMKKQKVDLTIIPTSDYHQSEYVADYFQYRKWLSGFTGSAGMLVVSEKESVLFTDGRYFIQAAKQLKGSGIKLMRMGNAKVPTLEEYIESHLNKGNTLGFDGRVLSTAEGNTYENIAAKKKAKINNKFDSAKVLFKPRPELPQGKLWLLDDKWSGESNTSKLKRVRKIMQENNAKYQLVTSLDEIAWLLNLRGSDIEDTPVFLSYALVGMKKVDLYLDLNKVDNEVKKALKPLVNFHPYEDVYSDLRKVSDKVMYDPKKVNYRLSNLLGNKGLPFEDPEILMKAVKNSVELDNLRQAHIYDGVALAKFIYWLKNKVQEKDVTEYEATEYLDQLRLNNPNCLGLSFGTIGAYNANAAMMHYTATKDNTATLKPEGIFLVDSGGQYYQGTTDVTRTIVLGKIVKEVQRDFTLTLKGNIRLSKARFLEGCRGVNLDILARGSLWDLGIDYKCGTGHGVGYLSGVHEAPNGFRWKIVPERNDSCILEPGMVTTIEPGVYTEGSHGIRIENELICKKAQENEYGQFLDFETITFAPIDRDAILPELLSDDELKFLNDYHAEVYRKLSGYLTKEEKTWLKKVTGKIERVNA